MTTRLKPYLPLIGLTAFATLFWGVLFAKTFKTLGSPDQLDYAQIAHNLLQGHFFTTNIILPLYLTKFATVVNHPEFLRAPGFSVLVALSQLIFGPQDFASGVVSGVAFIGSAALAYLISKELFKTEGLAIFTALVFIFNQEMAQNSTNGLADLTFAFFMIVLAYGLVKNWPSWLIGILIGLGYLLRYNFLIMVPGVLLYFWWMRPTPDRKAYAKQVGIVLGVALLVVLPWAIRNMVLVGSPSFTWPTFQYIMGTDTYPAQELYRQIITVNIPQFILSHLREMISKSIAGARQLYNGLPTVANFLVVAFFTASTLSRLGKDKRALALQWAVLVMAGLQTLALIPFEHEKIRLYIVFIPLMIVYAAQFVYALLAEIKLPRWGVVSGLAAFVVLVAIPTLPEFTGKTYRSDFVLVPAQLRTSEVMAHPEALIVTDAPGQVAWYLNRTAVGIPKTYADLQTIESLTPEPVYVYLYYTGPNDRYDRADEYSSQFMDNPAFLARYDLVQTFDTEARLYKLKRP